MKIRQPNYDMIDNGSGTTIVKPRQVQYKYKVIEEFESTRAFEAEVEKYLNSGYKLFGELSKNIHNRFYVSLVKEL